MLYFETMIEVKDSVVEIKAEGFDVDQESAERESSLAAWRTWSCLLNDALMATKENIERIAGLSTHLDLTS